jgi:hypothetical protein
VLGGVFGTIRDNLTGGCNGITSFIIVNVPNRFQNKYFNGCVCLLQWKRDTLKDRWSYCNISVVCCQLS